MAQWLGQFSGHTHATRVDDAEAALHHAVAVFLRATGSDKQRERKASSVRNLAARLLSARLKLMNARIADLQPVAEESENRIGGLEALQQRITKAKAEGVNGILAEFGATDALA
jgi:hypothetical protein